MISSHSYSCLIKGFPFVAKPNLLKRLFTATAILAVLLNLGCAGMSKEECQTADWELIGYADGSKGYSSSMIDRHRKDCAGVSSPVLSLYLQGHQRGLNAYCTEANGYRSGKRGAAMNTACNGEQAMVFQSGYDFGHSVYLVNREVDQHIKALTDSKQRRYDLEQRVIELEQNIIRPGLTASQRADLLLRIKRKREKISELDDKIDKQEHRLRESLAKFNGVNRQNPYENVPERGMPDIKISATKPKKQHDSSHRHDNGNQPRVMIETTP